MLKDSIFKKESGPRKLHGKGSQRDMAIHLEQNTSIDQIPSLVTKSREQLSVLHTKNMETEGVLSKSLY